MPIIVSINSGDNSDFELLSEGVHPAVLADIIDIGVVNTNFGPKHKIKFLWITEETDSKTGKPKYAFERVNLVKSLTEKAGLTKLVKAITGKMPEGENFDVESLIGRFSNLVIQHSEENAEGKVYANIIGHMKPSKRVAIPADFARAKDKDPKPQQQQKQQKPVVAAGGGRAVAAAVLAPVDNSPITDEDIPF